MDNETLHITKLLSFPQLSQNYESFGDEITEAFLNPTYQIIYQSWRNLPKTKNIDDNLDGLTEHVLSTLTSFTTTDKGEKTVKLRSGEKITTSSSKICASLSKLREYSDRFTSQNNESKEEGEKSFRGWLERSIVQRGVNSEPIFLTTNDPLSKSLEKLNLLKETKFTFSRGGDKINFPLSSYSITTKPKTPTSIETFDSLEFEGGPEEDTCLIIAGETNVGKSHLGLFCLSSLSLRKETVLLCSGEDSLETTRKRIFAHYLRKPTKEVIAMSEKERLRAFRELYGHEEDPESFHYHIIRNVAIACMEEGNFTPAKVKDRIEEVEQTTQTKIKAFMTDYIQKMSENPHTGGRNRKDKTVKNEELENVTNQIAEICQERNSFGIIISQIPSHAAGGQKEFLGIREAVARSYAATWGADYIITMNRTAQETQRLSLSNDKRPRLNLFLCKNKNGPIGVCYALGYPNEARWEFFREKAEMEREIESQKIETGRQLDIGSYRR